jgi:hypothetical protein
MILGKGQILSTHLQFISIYLTDRLATSQMSVNGLANSI